ncbi:MAG: M20/M25/M40 family metallo-hydrolase [Armatimonadota bacterium]
MLKRISFAIVVLAIGGNTFAQGDADTVKKILEEGKTRNQARSYLESITEQIGARLTSSMALESGQKWAMEQFTSFGCVNVHLEKWGEFPVGFDREKSGHVGRMTTPFNREFQFTTPSWTPGTKGLQKGGVVMEPASVEEVTKNASKFKGAWMILSATPPTPRPAGGAGATAAAGGGRPAPTPEQQTATELRNAIRAAAFKAGIKGTVAGSRNELVLTGGLYKIEWDKLPTETRITVRKSDYDAIVGAMKENKPVELQLDIKQSFRKGPIAIHNVIAEIPGTEKPEEVVIVSGHFDSWDGPGSQGALDNGTGSSVTLEAARILMASGAKPKRTIRFILWSGEEQGLFGSVGYVKSHAPDMDKISCCLVDDGGTNYWGGFVGLESQKPMFQPSIDALNEAFKDLPMVFRSQSTMPRGGGSDHASFNAVGVPGFFTLETGVSDYNYVHHTQHDKLQAAINAYLVQSSTAAALTSFNIACAPTMMPRAPKPVVTPPGK